MSSGRHHAPELTQSELDELLDEVLANPKVKRALTLPFTLVTEFDVPYLGSSSIGGKKVFLDRHLKFRDWPYGILPLQFRKIDVKPPLIRHERLEIILENSLNWSYFKYAHPTAQHYEERWVRLRGFDPKDYERMLRPFIKADEHEKLKKVPVDMDLRPELAPPKSVGLLDRIREVTQKEKQTHESVKYEEKSTHKGQKCELCRHFIEARYGGPACVGVRSVVDTGGWCRRFAAGRLGDKPEG
jgi:hypothetical protein